MNSTFIIFGHILWIFGFTVLKEAQVSTTELTLLNIKRSMDYYTIENNNITDVLINNNRNIVGDT